MLKQEQDGNTVVGEVQDERTGEIIPITDTLDVSAQRQSNTLATSLDLTKVGTLILDEKAETILSEPLKESDVQIRPDGLVYLPWTWYADRLNRAFGRLNWGLVPQAGPQSRDMGSMVLVVWGHWLVIRGVPVGFEIGETAYRPDNHQMSFGDAAAGAKSNSLARNCKMLGISLELWNQEWVSEWKKRNAETYESKGKTLWRKKTKRDNVQQHEPKSESVKAEESKPTDEPRFVWSEVKNGNRVKLVEEIANKSGKKKSEVATFLGLLEKGISYSVKEIVEKMNGAENVA